MPSRNIRWRDWSGGGLEHLALTQESERISMASTVISGRADNGFVAHYSIEMDSDWRVLNVHASVPNLATSIDLHRTVKNKWFDCDNTELHLLRGCVDVDLAISPSTNSLPIRRLQLEIGESAEISTVYIDFPHLTISKDPQRYTRLSAERYRYESLNTDFIREIVVDQDGFVVTYPGLFQRVP
jgi:uncharacterized protein